MHINQHLSFHVTVNVSDPLSPLSPIPPPTLLPPSLLSLSFLLSFPRSAVASA